MKRASSALEPLIKGLGLEGAMRLARIKAKWGALTGAPLSSHTSPASLSNGKLTVAVDTSAWLQQSRYYQGQLLTKLSAFGVSEIKFRLGRIAPPKTEGLPPKDDSPLPAETAAEIEALTSGVKDNALKNSIASAATRWAKRRKNAKRIKNP